MVNWRGELFGNLNSFSLLFGPRFPVMPESFPVNFHREIRRKPAWMLALSMISSAFQGPIFRVSLYFSLLFGK
jgi:hypothetical protein